MMPNDTTNTPAVPVQTTTGFGQLRSVTRDGQVWFVAKDVCAALGITNTAMALLNISSTDVHELRLVGQRGGRPSKMVNESGLNALVLQSRKPAAVAFRQHITAVVMPSLRRFGVYVAGQERMTDAEVKAATTERVDRLVMGTRAERYARIAEDREKFVVEHGRQPTAKERYFLEKP
ncbi:hypothetical protein D2T31_09360 [Sinirhodobacter populi]|uniref:Bro-N domain-containing protein n=1 Tax=Paenirhodobacter populi TaxID=2306993 RepID=A0A443KA00_9RHOB|nr:Bro-N domain-containing protein [Sinirhodobacter populi]RWR29641.1 hypothetical protein D2T31_09360 [Sinirhodobacter populi]